MVRTYEIDLDDKLVNDASEIFETLGSDIDSAIKIFLTQAILRKGFPFEVAVPQSEKAETEKENLLEENAIAFEKATETAGNSVSENDVLKNSFVAPENGNFDDASKIYVSDSETNVSENKISAEPDSYKIETLKKDIEELKSETNGSKTDVSESRESESQDSETDETEKNISETTLSKAQVSENFENQSSESKEGNLDSEDEDETAPENLFSQWDKK